MRFAREEAEPQAMTRAAILVARHLIETIVLETRNVVAVEAHRRYRRAQVDDEQCRTGAPGSCDGRERRRYDGLSLVGALFHVFFPMPESENDNGELRDPT